MLITKEVVQEKNIKWLTIEEFVNNYHIGITTMSVSTAMDNDYIDYMKPSRDRFILLTQKTLSWPGPRRHKVRTF
jgi:hypothetical protein